MKQQYTATKLTTRSKIIPKIQCRLECRVGMRWNNSQIFLRASETGKRSYNQFMRGVRNKHSFQWSVWIVLGEIHFTRYAIVKKNCGGLENVGGIAGAWKAFLSHFWTIFGLLFRFSNLGFQQHLILARFFFDQAWLLAQNLDHPTTPKNHKTSLFLTCAPFLLAGCLLANLAGKASKIKQKQTHELVWNFNP